MNFALKKSLLNQLSSFSSFTLAQNLENLIVISSDQKIALLNQPIHHQKDYVTNALNTITKPLGWSLQKVWVQLLFIDTLFSTCRAQLLSYQLIDFISAISKNLSTELDAIKSQNLSKNILETKSETLAKVISMGLSKFKSLLYSSQKQTQIQSSRMNVSEKIITTSRDSTKQPVVETLLGEILLYERKKLQNFEFFQIIKQRYERDGPFIASQEGKQKNLMEFVWKIINLIKPQNNIINTYKKFSSLINEIKPLMVATIYRFCKDSLMLYPYITEYIQLRTKEIQQKYDVIIAQKLPKQLKNNRLQLLRKSKEFVEVENLIEQLSDINQTMLYMFCSKSHCRYLDFKTPRNFFLSTNNHRLDKFYHIMNELKKIQKKNQLSKKHMSQMVEKLDESINKVLEKEKAMNSWNDIRTEGKGKESCEPTHEEEELMRSLPNRNKDRESFFFEEITENI